MLALAWAKRGFKVFPVLPRRKEPAIKGWIEAASSDEDKIIQAWQKAGSDCNVGVRSGSGALQDGGGLLVIDADLHKAGAEESLRRLRQEFPEIDHTLQVQTPRGGRHFYLRLPEGVDCRNSVEALGPGLDVRAQHGYVLAPGSAVADPVTGVDGLYREVCNAPLAIAPPSLIGRLRAPRERSAEHLVPLVDLDKDSAIARAVAYLSVEAPPAVEGQGGNDTTYRVACQVRGFGISEATAADLMAEHYNERCCPPWALEELSAIVEHAYAYAVERPGTDAAEAHYAGVDVLQFESAQTTRRFSLLPMSQFMAGASSSAYLVKKLLPYPGLAVIWGPAKVGKSFFVIDLFLHVALGWSFRGRRVKQGTVVYCGLEGQSGLAWRLKAFADEKLKGQSGADAFKIMGQPLAMVKEHKAFIADITAQLAPGDRPVAVVIDTLNRSFEGSESSDEDMTAFIRAADAIRLAFGCLVVIVHHSGHNEERMRGHTSLIGATDVSIKVEKDTAGSIVATVMAAKDIEAGTEIVSTLRTVTLGKDDEGDDITSCVLEPSEAAGGDAVAVRVFKTCHLDQMDMGGGAASVGGDYTGVPERTLKDQFVSRWLAERGGKPASADKAFRRVLKKAEGEGWVFNAPGKVIVLRGQQDICAVPSPETGVGTATGHASL